MCVPAHPGDESLGTGGTLAKYTAEGVETCLVTATRGWFGNEKDNPGVVITLDPNGAYGQPDHSAICQFATAAVLAAADPGDSHTYTSHRVSKLIT